MEWMFYIPFTALALLGVWSGFVRDDQERGIELCVVGLFGFVLVDLVLYQFVNPMTAALALANLWLWWNGGGGKRRRKQARELGAKGKAKIQALLRTLQPAPQPQGA